MSWDRIQLGSLATSSNYRMSPVRILESVAELVEEGNAFEADAVDGVENANDPDVSEVTTREEPEDGVPQEYLSDGGRVA